jgi:hypothetical protein
MGYARKLDRFPSPLFLFSLGRLGARSLGNYTERCHIKCEMKAPRIDPAVLELAALSALAALGCGLAAAQGDLWFVTVFGAASLVTIIEAVRRLL